MQFSIFNFQFSKKKGHRPAPFVNLFFARKRYLQTGAGFSLLEVIISVFILTVGILGVVGLLTRSLQSVDDVKNRVIAANLAQEGIELVRYQRDSNWLQFEDYDKGLANGSYCAQYNSFTLNSCSDFTIYKEEATGIYSHDSSGRETPFSREIIISRFSNPEDGFPDPDPDVLQILSIVRWNDAELIVEDHLYDWR